MTSRPLITPAVIKSPGSLLELGAFIIIAILFFWFIVGPKRSLIAAGQAQVQTLTQESEKFADQQNKIQNLVKQLTQSSKEISELDESLPLHPRTTWLYLLVENLANSSGITIGNLTVANAEEEIMAAETGVWDKPYGVQRTLKKATVNLGVTGTFSQLQAFLKKLEDNGRIMNVKALDISASADELLDFRLTLEAYYFTP